MKLYSYWRSSTAYRVRIAMNLKGLRYDLTPRNLLGAEQREVDYLKLNPLGAVPTLVLDDGTVLIQSLAILEYLEETHPKPPLLPKGAIAKARVRALALTVACEMHNVNNMKVLQHITGPMGHSEGEKLHWMHHWMHEGFKALESQLAHHPDTGMFCHGDTPTIADVCLVPQVYNARRFQLDMGEYPTISAIADACNQLPAFRDAAPENQPDAQ